MGGPGRWAAPANVFLILVGLKTALHRTHLSLAFLAFPLIRSTIKKNPTRKNSSRPRPRAPAVVDEEGARRAGRHPRDAQAQRC